MKQATKAQLKTFKQALKKNQFVSEKTPYELDFEVPMPEDAKIVMQTVKKGDRKGEEFKTVAFTFEGEPFSVTLHLSSREDVAAADIDEMSLGLFTAQRDWPSTGEVRVKKGTVVAKAFVEGHVS